MKPVRSRVIVPLAFVALAGAVLVPGSPFASGDPAGKAPAPAPAADVDQKAIDDAIARGVESLRKTAGPYEGNLHTELTLLTLLHAGVPLDDPVVSASLEVIKHLDVTNLPFREKTYRISLAAMCLEDVNPSAFQGRLAEFAQFLVCNQCENGQWSYGENIEAGKKPAGGDDGRIVETGGGDSGPKPAASQRGKTAAVKQVKIACDKPIGPKTGDHSNTQFALLGLRACAEAGCVIPKEVWTKSLTIVEQAQKTDGGWGYTYASPLNAQGSAKVVDAGGSYGSMTCSGVCDLIICRHYLEGDHWKSDPKIQAGLAWIGSNFTVTENAKMASNPAPNAQGGGATWHYYYLYALERTGMLAGVEKFGPRPWYSHGAKYLLKQQQPDGSWQGSASGIAVQDTCFAILFLRRATKPITTLSTK